MKQQKGFKRRKEEICESKRAFCIYINSLQLLIYKIELPINLYKQENSVNLTKESTNKNENWIYYNYIQLIITNLYMLINQLFQHIDNQFVQLNLFATHLFSSAEYNLVVHMV